MLKGLCLGFIPAIYNSEYVDDVVSIEESLARQTCKELASKEGMTLVVPSSGMNVAGGNKVVQELRTKIKGGCCSL